MEFSLSRFKNIETRQFKCEVVTPMFLGGADGRSAELRAESIKGALRFWWRALYGSDDIEDMKKREMYIFGSTEKKSNLNLQIIESNIEISSEKLHRSGFHILNYLAYGYDDNKGTIRQYIQPKSTFDILIRINDRILEESRNYYDEIKNSLSAIICLGGLGMRSRSGFGSIFSKEMDGFNINKYRVGDLKRYTSLTAASRLFKSKSSKNSWKEALIEIGNIYKEAKMLLKSIGNDKRQYIDGGKSHHPKPYFLHINKLDNGKFKGQILFMPYKYSLDGTIKHNQLNEYINACNKMNEFFENNMDEVKYEF